MKGAASRGAGRTPLFKSIEYCGRCNGAKVFVKDESKNPFGTFKDRRCAALLEHYSSKKELVFVHITSGNSGYSLGRMAAEEERKTGRKIQVVNIIPKGSNPKTVEALKSCSKVVEMDLSELISMEKMRGVARKATGFSGPESDIVGVEDYGLANGYGAIINEIHEEGLKPKYIFCPVGEGELLVELAAESKKLWGKNAPYIVGTTIPQNVLSGEKEFSSKPGKNVADKLVNGYSKFRNLIKGFISEARVGIITAGSESRIAEEYNYLTSIGINVEPSSAVAFVGAREYGLISSDTAVIVNTGKGIFDESSLKKVWKFRAKRILKAAALVAAGVALSLGIYFGNQEYQDYKLRESIDLALETDLLAQNDGWHHISKEKFMCACTRIPDMDREKCENAGSFLSLTERQTRFYRLINSFDHDSIFRPMLPLFREWYAKYPTWMPGEEWPETFEMDSRGYPIESTRKPKPQYSTPSKSEDCERYKRKGIRLPPSIDYCP